MAYLEIGLAGIIWASTGPLLRLLQNQGFSPIDIILGRALFSLCFMGVMLAFLPRRRDDRLIPSAQDIPVFLALGFLAVLFSQTTYFYALSMTSVAVAVTLNYTAPFFVMVISYLVYKEPITKTKAFSLLVAAFGVMLVSGFLGGKGGALNLSATGVSAGLLSGLSYGSQTIVYKKVGVKYGPLPLNFWTMASGGAILVSGLTILKGHIPTVFLRLGNSGPLAWLLFMVIGLGPGCLAFVLFADGINKVEATRGAIVAMSEPIAACILGYLVLGEKLTLPQLIGVGLVLGAIVAVSFQDVRERRKKQCRSTMAPLAIDNRR